MKSMKVFDSEKKTELSRALRSFGLRISMNGAYDKKTETAWICLERGGKANYNGQSVAMRIFEHLPDAKKLVLDGIVFSRKEIYSSK